MVRTFGSIIVLSWLTIAPAAGVVPQIGNDDFRITRFGPDGDTTYFAERPQIAYNSVDDEYFVVFRGTSDDPRVLSNEIELWGQRVATTGVLLGPPTLLTQVGELGADNGDAPQQHRIAYAPTGNSYLLVYSAYDSYYSGSASQVYQVEIDAAGNPQGRGNAVSISGFDVVGNIEPDIAFNSHEDLFLVVWTSELIAGGDELRARIIPRKGFEGSQFRVDSDDGRKGGPSIAYNNIANEFLLTWRQEDTEIRYGRLDSAGSALPGFDRVLVDSGTFSSGTTAAYSPAHDEYLVVFGHSDPQVGIVDEAFELFGTRIGGDGNRALTEKFRISYSPLVEQRPCTGANLDLEFDTTNDVIIRPCRTVARAGLTYSSFEQRFVVTWSSSTTQVRGVESQAQVRLLAGGRDPINGSEQAIVSQTGAGQNGYFAHFPMVAARPGGGFLVTWWGDDNRNNGVQNEVEIWGQLMSSDLMFVDEI